MAQPKPDESVSLDQVLKLVEKLSPADQEELRRKLDAKSWGQEWRRLQDEIEARRIARGLPRLTDEEIMAEVKAVREQRKARRAQGGN